MKDKKYPEYKRFDTSVDLSKIPSPNFKDKIINLWNYVFRTWAKDRVRQTDNDHNWWIFTFYNSKYPVTGVDLDSGDGEEYHGCSLTVQIYKLGCAIHLPPIIKPKQLPLFEDDKYKDSLEGVARRYGIKWNHGDHASLLFYWGFQSMNNDNYKQSYMWAIPWLDWTFVEHRLYDTEGNLYGKDSDYKTTAERPISQWEKWHEFEKLCPANYYTFEDGYDKEIICAKVVAEEMEWHHGAGSFKWLRHITRNKIRRNIRMEFDREVGERKGSWKGGILGTGSEANYPMSHFTAFTMWCSDNGHNFLREVSKEDFRKKPYHND